MVKKLVLFLLILSVAPDFALGKVRAATLFSDNMVLQREEPIAVWGTANPKERLRVGFHISSVSCCADAEGNWAVHLPPEQAGGPYRLTIQTDTETTIYRNILVGDVWFASGQSNMEHPMEGWDWLPYSAVYRSEEEIADSDYPEIRLFTVPKYPSSLPVNDLPEGSWQPASPESLRSFSSTAWFFAKELYARLHIPIGIMNCSWAGTSIKTWISPEVIAAFRDSLEPTTAEIIPPHEVIVNTLIHNKSRRCQISYPKTGQLERVMRQDSFQVSQVRSLSELELRTDLPEVIWLKKEIDIPESPAKESMELLLGFLNRQSIVYFNGVEVGDYTYPEPVVARIPRKLIWPGKNSVIIRVARPFGSPRLQGDSALFSLSTRNQAFRYDLSQNWLMNHFIDTIPLNKEDYRNFTGALFNGMIHPCLKFKIKGVIWYQGEDDVYMPRLYARLFKAHIEDWRAKWGKRDLPFLYVQLSSVQLSHQVGKDDGWSVFREYQQIKLPNVGMVVSTDIGDPYDVHPKNKKEFGRRLVEQALVIAY